MSSPEPSLSLDIRQPRSFSTPLARITRSCAASVYLWKRQKTARECSFCVVSYQVKLLRVFKAGRRNSNHSITAKQRPFQFSDRSCSGIWRYLTGTNWSRSHPSFWVPGFTSFQKNIKILALTSLLFSSLKKMTEKNRTKITLLVVENYTLVDWNIWR